MLVDGLPLAYLLPVDLGCLMRSEEDRGMDYLSATLVRLLRWAALLLALLLPGLYIAMGHLPAGDAPHAPAPGRHRE